MISGIALLTSTLLATVPSPPPSPEPLPPEVAALIAGLKQPAPADTPFAEVRFSTLLKRPLQLRGELHYGGAGLLGKRVEAPYRETTTIANGQVEVNRDGRATRRFSLERAPELGAFLAGLCALLGGDAAQLNQHFVIAHAGNGSAWRLILKPRAADLAKHLLDLVVDGGHDGVHCISLRESDGDASVMRLGVFVNFKLPDPPTYAALEAVCRPASVVY